MEEIKDYLHLYLGCECLLEGIDPEIDGKGKLVSIDLTSCICVLEDMSINYCVEANVSDVKPILRRLESMTEYEAREFCKMEGWGENLENIVVTDNAIEFTQDQRTQAISRFNRCRPLMFVWLLSKGFDLFNLIDYNLAIDKDKT